MSADSAGSGEVCSGGVNGTKVEVSESAGEGVRGTKYWELALTPWLDATASAVRVVVLVYAVTVVWTGDSGASRSGAWTVKWGTAWEPVIIVCIGDGVWERVRFVPTIAASKKEFKMVSKSYL